MACLYRLIGHIGPLGEGLVYALYIFTAGFSMVTILPLFAITYLKWFAIFAVLCFVLLSGEAGRLYNVFAAPAELAGVGAGITAADFYAAATSGEQSSIKSQDTAPTSSAKRAESASAKHHTERCTTDSLGTLRGTLVSTMLWSDTPCKTQAEAIGMFDKTRSSK